MTKSSTNECVLNSECVLNNIIESINNRKKPDFSNCPDSRPTESFEPGDIVAGIWFNDPNWYAGKLESTEEGLAIPIHDKSVGFMEDAYHFVKICSKRK